MDRCQAIEQDLPHNNGDLSARQPLSIADRGQNGLLVKFLRAQP